MPGPVSSILDRLGSRPAWVTAVDLILVYYLIYRALLTIRGTRAAQMVVGIVLVGAGFYAARRLELTAVSWLLDAVINYLILIVIVVFQADIRRALGRLGQGVLPRARAGDASEVIDEVAAAVAQLARARRGAIIVLERDAEVAAYVEDATGKTVYCYDANGHPARTDKTITALGPTALRLDQRQAVDLQGLDAERHGQARQSGGFVRWRVGQLDDQRPRTRFVDREAAMQRRLPIE